MVVDFTREFWIYKIQVINLKLILCYVLSCPLKHLILCNLSLDHFTKFDEYPKNTDDVIECAGFTLAKKQETGLVPYINAFRLDKENEKCEAGSIPCTRIQNMIDAPALTEEQSGIYVDQENNCFYEGNFNSVGY